MSRHRAAQWARFANRRSIPAGGSAEFTFLLAWHFPNRTPEWCGWDFPKGEGQTIIGNYYATRFKDAWEVAAYTATNLESLESRTRSFRECLRRQHAARGRQRGGKRQSLHPGNDHLLPHCGWRISWLRRLR